MTGRLYLGLWLGGTLVLALILLALRLPANQVVAFTLFGSLLGGVIALTLRFSNEERSRDHHD
ncbi:MAG: hypothetical protein ACLPYS_03665 [Vulcanimicrobiaceae bacterium]